MPTESQDPFIHSTAEISAEARIGTGCKIWGQVHVREGAEIGPGCIIGAGAYVGAGVRLGRNCKVQNQALLYEGLELGDGVFVGPQVCFTNDMLPRAVNPDMSLKSADDWHLGQTRVHEGAAVGAQTVVITGVTIGRWALVGAGSVVRHDVPDYALVYGRPARIRGWVCESGHRVVVEATPEGLLGRCDSCGATVNLPREAAAFVNHM
jgi:acetyltransferase-like isoleucine patch superfamily enzyme